MGPFQGSKMGYLVTILIGRSMIPGSQIPGVQIPGVPKFGVWDIQDGIWECMDLQSLDLYTNGPLDMAPGVPYALGSPRPLQKGSPNGPFPQQNHA